jgi:hypothetical protein
VCGEMAGNPLGVFLLLGLGINALSVAPSSLPEVKKVIRSVPAAERGTGGDAARCTRLAGRSHRTPEGRAVALARPVAVLRPLEPAGRIVKGTGHAPTARGYPMDGESAA